MRLISLHIENYGKISDKDYNFTDGINQFYAENGYGKTTLASFIKAMFYGLAPCRSNGKDFNDRKRFYPFSGGKFGGNIVFEFAGDEYRVERFFGKKSDTEDELKVYKNATEIKDMKPDLGTRFFGLDEESFLRTFFIDSEVSEVSSTDAINRLIGTENSGNTDENGFDLVKSRLETAAKKYKAQKGNNDKISLTKQKISELKDRIENLEKVSDSLGGKYEELAELKKAEASLAEKIKKANENKVEAEKRKAYLSLKETAEERDKKLKELKGKYPYGIMNEAELENAETLAETIEKSLEKGGETVFGDEKTERLRTYTRTFASGTPTNETFKRLDGEISELEKRRAEADVLNDDLSKERRGFYGDKFKGEDTAERIESLRKTIDDLGYLEKTAASVSDKKGTPASLIGVAVSAVLAIIGIILPFALPNVKNGVFMSVAIVVISLIYAVINVRKYIKTTKTGKAERKDVENEIRETERTIGGILRSFGYAYDYGAERAYAELSRDYADYLSLGQEKEKTIRRLKDRLAGIEKKEESLKKSFAVYGLYGENYRDMYYALKRAVDDYAALNKERVESQVKSKGYLDKADDARRLLKDVFSKRGLLVDSDVKTQLKNLSADFSEIKRLENEVKQATEKAEKYRIESKITEVNPTTSETTYEELNEKYRLTQSNIAALKSSISEDESKCESLYEKRLALEEEEEKLAAYKEKYADINSAKEYLVAANDRLLEKYVAPIKDKFVEYSVPLEKALGEKVVMDKDYRIFFERGGEIRDNKHLSAGQRCILSLAFRLSLIENAFDGEKPFVIMDDPFVHLDGEHIEKTANFLKEIAKNEQIIYFCCHDSRKIV